MVKPFAFLPVVFVLAGCPLPAVPTPDGGGLDGSSSSEAVLQWYAQQEKQCPPGSSLNLTGSGLCVDGSAPVPATLSQPPSELRGDDGGLLAPLCCKTWYGNFIDACSAAGGGVQADNVDAGICSGGGAERDAGVAGRVVPSYVDGGYVGSVVFRCCAGRTDAGVCPADTCMPQRSGCVAVSVDQNGTAVCKCYCLSSDAGVDGG